MTPTDTKHYKLSTPQRTPSVAPSTVHVISQDELIAQLLERIESLEMCRTSEEIDPSELPENNMFYGMPPNYFVGQTLPSPHMFRS